MSYDKYKKIILKYIIITNQSRYLLKYSMMIFKDFPKKLPDYVKEEFKNDVSILLEIMRDAEKLLLDKDEELVKDHTLSKRTKVEGNEASDMFIEKISFITALMQNKQKFKDIDFSSIILSQSLIINLAYLEAFLNDSIRSLCAWEPRIILKHKGDKSISWKEILELKDWHSLISGMIEKYVYDFGYLSLDGKIKQLKDALKINIELKQEDLNKLLFYVNTRNSYVHNGGFVSKEFINNTKKINHNYQEGEKIELNESEIFEIIDILESIACQTFIKISVKYYKIDFHGLPIIPFQEEWLENI